MCGLKLQIDLQMTSIHQRLCKQPFEIKVYHHLAYSIMNVYDFIRNLSQHGASVLFGFPQ